MDLKPKMLVHCLIILQTLFCSVNCVFLSSSQLNRNEASYIDCKADYNTFHTAVESSELWALRVIDSWGKLPSGVLYGHKYNFGNFDECLDPRNEHKHGEDVIKFQYCLIDWTFYGELKSLITNELPTGNDNTSLVVTESTNDVLTVTTGICMPRVCIEDKMNEFIWRALRELQHLNLNFTDNPQVNLVSNSCIFSKVKPFRAVDYIAVVAISFLLGIIGLCTFFHFVAQQDQGRGTNSFFRSFSVIENIKQIFTFKKQDDDTNFIYCLNGIRALSLIWIVYGHTYAFNNEIGEVNEKFMQKWVLDMWNLPTLAGNASVDSFLVLSGILVAWTTLKYMDTHDGKLNIFTRCVHRFIRLTPALLMSIMIFSFLCYHLDTGPIWNTMYSIFFDCTDNWWTTLLYIQNYVNPEKMCLGHTWYLSVDTQLFILAPVVVYPLWKWRHKAIWWPILLMVCSVLFVIFTFINYQIPLHYFQNTTEKQLRMVKTYFPTHARMGAWIIGVIFGYYLHYHKFRRIILSKEIAVIGWIICILGLFGILFGMFLLQENYHDTTILEGAIYETGSRIAWAIGICWIVLACYYGFGGPINKFLSAQIWQPISTLSYTIYLVHLPLQALMVAGTRTSVSIFGDVNSIFKFWGNFGFAATIGIVFCLSFEMPFTSFEKNIRHPSPQLSKSDSSMGIVDDSNNTDTWVP